MCYATGNVPCSDECADAGRCLLSPSKSRVTMIGPPQSDGRSRVSWFVEGKWVPKGWLMPQVRE